jgi:hypothetical protein
MKHYTLTALLLITIFQFSFGQQVKFSELSKEPNGGPFKSYIASDGAEYKIGDRIKIGIPSNNKTFSYIEEGDGIFLPITNLSTNYSGHETEIKRIWVSGNDRSGYFVKFRTKGDSGISNYTIMFEKALETGEVKGFGKSSDQALTELKKAKDKLDLGLITQDEFNKLRTDLGKFIK